MAIKAHHVFIGIGVAGLGYLYVKGKIQDWQKTLKKLVPIPSGFRKLDLNFKRIKFTMDLTIHNPTDEDFSPNGVIVTLKKIIVRDLVGNQIAQVSTNITSISIPAKKKVTVNDLVVEIPVYDSLVNLPNLVKIKSIDDVKISVVLSALGQEYTI